MSCVILARDIRGISIDAVISEEITSTMELPEHPIEKGAKITDHAWRKPDSIKLEFAISDENAVAAYNALRSVMEAATLFTFVTGFRAFNNMAIQELTPKRDKETSRILSANITLKEVIIVSTQYGPANISKSGKGDEKGADEAKRGQVQNVPVSDAENIIGKMEAL